MAELLSIVNKIKQQELHYVEGLIDENFYIAVPNWDELEKLNNKIIKYADVDWLEREKAEKMYDRYKADSCVCLETDPDTEEFMLSYANSKWFKREGYKLVSIDNIL